MNVNILAILFIILVFVIAIFIFSSRSQKRRIGGAKIEKPTSIETFKVNERKIGGNLEENRKTNSKNRKEKNNMYYDNTEITGGKIVNGAGENSYCTLIYIILDSKNNSTIPNITDINFDIVYYSDNVSFLKKLKCEKKEKLPKKGSESNEKIIKDLAHNNMGLTTAVIVNQEIMEKIGKFLKNTDICELGILMYNNQGPANYNNYKIIRWL